MNVQRNKTESEAISDLAETVRPEVNRIKMITKHQSSFHSTLIPPFQNALHRYPIPLSNQNTDLNSFVFVIIFKISPTLLFPVFI